MSETGYNLSFSLNHGNDMITEKMRIFGESLEETMNNAGSQPLKGMNFVQCY